VPKLGDWTVHQVLLVQSKLVPAGARYITLDAVQLHH